MCSFEFYSLFHNNFPEAMFVFPSFLNLLLPFLSFVGNVYNICKEMPGDDIPGVSISVSPRTTHAQVMYQMMLVLFDTVVLSFLLFFKILFLGDMCYS